MSDRASLNLTIDGREVTCPAGSTLLEAARAAGVDVPTLCAHPSLKPFGGCRLCIVEVEGQRGYPAACTQPATAGAVVHTDSDELLRLRRATLALLLTKHPTGCLMCGHDDDCINHHGCHSRRSGAVTGCRFCPNDQQCELQTLVERLALTDMPFPVEYRGLPVDRRSPFLDFDPNLCVLCGRCVRACDELRGASAIALTERGEDTLVAAVGGAALLDTSCQFCGACVDVCPTGSLSERVNKWVGLPNAWTVSTCGFCPLGCQLELRAKDGQLIGARPVEHQAICSVGRFAPVEAVAALGRVLEPLVREGHHLIETDWETALDAAAQGLAGQAAVFASADLLTEELQAIRALAGDGPVATDASGFVASTATLADVEAASVLVTVRTDLRYRHTPVQLALRGAVDRGAELLAIEPLGHDPAPFVSLRVGCAAGDEAAALAGLLADPAAAALLALPGEKVIVCGPTVDAGVVAAVQALAASVGARWLLLAERANARGASEILGGVPFAPVEGALLSFGRPPGATRPARGFWVAHTHLSDKLLEQADVVLPAALFTEQTGSFVGLDGQQRAVAPALPAQGEARDAAWVCAELTRRLTALGVSAPPPPPPTPTATDDGLLVLREASGYSLLGHRLATRVAGLLPLANERILRVHPATAAEQGLAEGDKVELRGPGGAKAARVRLTDELAPGVARLAVPSTDETDPAGPPLAALFGPNPSCVQVVPVAVKGAPVHV